ncbi:hypothetical protein [Pseudomonas putida]|uniref:Sel1 repeat family protein n=1 Tax=Pseudomonas putida TaxID=303 RepID=A0A1Q9QYW1_PSEPU|nr:hypothetical protein [Pseudomonas putida]OLS60307.1 hypothetical protein PSEMO_47180 [Pseudomonas putida]
MPRHHRFYTLAACLLSQACVASPLQIDPRGDSLYQQAVPYLQQADSKFEAVTAITPETSEAEEQRSLGLAAEGGALLKPAVQLLEQAAALGHPVAQYRLGLIRVMLLAPSEVIEEKACPLFEQSLAQGFAPPAVVISTWCLAHAKTPLYQAQLQAVEAAMPGYEQYFPQPGVWLECKPGQPVGMALQWGSSRDYQAEVYRLLGDWNRAQRSAFYQKAVDLNDCAKARKRLRP